MNQGARARGVLGRLMVGAAVGLTLGVLAAIQASGAAASLLYGVNPRDPSTLAAIVGVIMTAGLGAAALPARRALRTDPVAALKNE